MVKKPVENSKIKEVEKLKNDVNFQFGPFVICPLPLRSPRLRDIVEGNVKSKEYKPYFEVRVGKWKVTIRSDPRVGYPHGQDNLIILYLIKKALEQNNNGFIEFKSLNDFLKTFELSKGKDTYKNIIKGFKRIRVATFDYVNEEKPKKNIEKQKAGKYGIIGSWYVSFSEKNGQQLEMFNSYIKLDPTFWGNIIKSKVPYDLNVVKKLKQSPATVNLYILLCHRTYNNWRYEKKEIFIPFFGENGLKNQLSSTIANKRRFKEEMINCLKKIEKVWPECPVYLKKEKNFRKKGPAFNKIYQDGLFIHTKKASQLSVSPHWEKLLRQAREEAEAATAAKTL